MRLESLRSHESDWGFIAQRCFADHPSQSWLTPLEEHIDNPRDYADNEDAQKLDSRLRAPVQPIELGIDSETGLKNYIANERLGIATSIGYVKYSLSRSIHYGRTYTSGTGTKGRLYVALYPF